MSLAFISLFCYFFGSIGGSAVFSRLLYKEKGYITWREYKAGHASLSSRLPVVLFDGFKIVVSALVLENAAMKMGYTSEFWRLMGALLSTQGHCHPFFGTRRGGEAMEGSVITAFLMSPLSGIVSVLAFLLVYFVWGRKSLSTLISMIAFPFSFILFSHPSFETASLSILYALLVIMRQKRDMNEFLSD